MLVGVPVLRGVDGFGPPPRSEVRDDDPVADARPGPGSADAAETGSCADDAAGPGPDDEVHPDSVRAAAETTTDRRASVDALVTAVKRGIATAPTLGRVG